MSLIPASVSRTVARQALIAQKNSPKLLFVAGIVGFGATVVLSSRATVKMNDVIDNAQDELQLAQTMLESEEVPTYNEAEHREDVTKIYIDTAFKTAKLYAPAIIIGGLSVACLTKSHTIQAKRNSALTAAYISLERAYTSYRDKVCAEVGREKEMELYEKPQICQIHDPYGNPQEAQITSSPYAKFFDRTNKHYNLEHDRNVIFITLQQNYLNDRLKARGHVFLNEVYDALGMDHTTAGAVTGWVVGNGDDYIDFGPFHDRDATTYRGRDGAILLDFNVDGLIYELI